MLERVKPSASATAATCTPYGRLFRPSLAIQYSSCADSTTDVYAALKLHVRAGHLVIFHGQMTADGHYVRVIGYGLDAVGNQTVMVDDPYGSYTTSSRPYWNPANSTAVTDTTGSHRTLPWSLIYKDGRGDGIVACQ